MPKEDQAWHAGIKTPVQTLYAQPPSIWRGCLYYFLWYRGYLQNAVFLDAQLKPVDSTNKATFVARADVENGRTRGMRM